MKENILKQFDDTRSNLESLKGKMELLICELIKNDSTQAHQIIGRLKERSSIESKIEKKQDKYSSLQDITDIVGIRVITYLESDVDRVADIIEREFEIDKENSIDKRKLNFDQFGYRSLHFVVSCSDKRTSLAEYKSFYGIKFEIQIRSILQHAWAEIEHDLGYKGITSIPDAYKRGFNRLAALLESADIEFDRLKNELKKYEVEVPSLIKTRPENVAIDQASLISFISSNRILIETSNLISKNLECEFVPNKDYAYIINTFKNFFKIKTIQDLSQSLEKNEKLFLAFVNESTISKKRNNVLESVSIFYFQHFLAALNEDSNYMYRYLNFGEVPIGVPLDEFIGIIKKVKLNKAI